jgi:hypothetical protein
MVEVHMFAENGNYNIDPAVVQSSSKLLTYLTAVSTTV